MIRKKDSIWLYHMIDELLAEGKIMFLYRRKDGSVGVSLSDAYVSRRKGSKKAEGSTLKDAVKELYRGRTPC